MNFRRVIGILSFVLYSLAIAQLIPLAWCLHPFDRNGATGLLVGAAAAAVFGTVFRLVGRTDGELYRREGVLVVVLAWLFASVTGAIPYLASGAIALPTDALFESVSGFTTTGASILADIEALPAGLLVWRSMTQWLGGIGIVVLFVALLSELGPGARFLVKLEVPGSNNEIMHARVREAARSLFLIYLGLSVAQLVLMLLFGATLFDAVTHTFATVSTGGFSPYSDSVAHFSTPLQGIVLLFMLVSGANFGLYFALIQSRDFGIFRDVEFRFYLALATVVTVVAAIDIYASGWNPDPFRDLFDAAFHVVSLLTTTGFATADFAQWPGFAHTALVSVMFAGGCAGSTAGGAKLVRLLIGIKIALREVHLTFNPRSVIAIAVGDRVVPEASAQGAVSLLVLWLFGCGVGALLLSVGDTDFVTAATASLATISNVGPGLAAVGPTENFAFFASWQKLVMIVLMWLGRLEFFALLALVLPRFWRV